MFTKSQYMNEINVSPVWKKCASPANLEKLLAFLEKYKPIPSQATIKIAVDHLRFPRTDGRTDADDQQSAQANYDAAVDDVYNLPLTKDELEEFSSLSPGELQRRYFEDNHAGRFFKIRYDRAIAEAGYRRPYPPTLNPQAAAAAVPKGQELELSLQEYRSTPVRVVTQRCLREPRYLAAVKKLAAEGKI